MAIPCRNLSTYFSKFFSNETSQVLQQHISAPTILTVLFPTLCLCLLSCSWNRLFLFIKRCWKKNTLNYVIISILHSLQLSNTNTLFFFNRSFFKYLNIPASLWWPCTYWWTSFWKWNVPKCMSIYLKPSQSKTKR